MAKYIVEDVKTSKFEKNYKFPLINLIPAIVWCILLFSTLNDVPFFTLNGAVSA